MKIKLNNLTWDKEIYPRSNLNQKTLESYTQAWEAGADFPAIEIQKIKKNDEIINVITDGVHRWKAKKEAEIDEKTIECREWKEGELDYKESKWKLLLRSANLNATHGDRLSYRDKEQQVARPIAKNDPKKEITEEEIAEDLGISQQTVNNWISDIRAEQKASRNNKIYKLSLLGWTQKEIAESVGISRGRIAQVVNNTNYGKINNSIEENLETKSMEEIANYNNWDMQFTWAMRLWNKDDDLERFEELDITKKKFTVWNYTSAHDLMGDENFDGRIPGQIPFNAIHRWSSQDDLVVDPMAGSGTTQDACLLLNRENKSYDINPQRNSIVKNDINNGLPIDKADFVFVNPPYWNMVDYEEGGSDQPLTKFYEETMTNLIQESYRILDKGNYFALIIANQSAKKWLEKSDETKNMHRLDHVLRTIDLAQDNNFDLQWRIYTPQPTQNAQRWAQAEWDEDRLAEIGRELLIFKKE